MSLFHNVFSKLRKSSAFEFVNQWFATTTNWDADKLRKDISNGLIKLDFQLDLANSLSEKLVQELKRHKDLTESVIREKLIALLINHYSDFSDPLSENKNNSLKVPSPSLRGLNFKPNQCNVFFIAGSNGVGKTSFISKLVYLLKIKYQLVKKILLVAGDTFRAGAVDQLDILAKQLKVDIVTPNLPEKASALIYRSLRENQSKYELIILDSSGRQYNNQNLLMELKKQYSIVEKIMSRPPEESFLIVDSTLGNYSQQELTKLLEIIPISALVLTKMDNTTRGGVIYNLRPKYSIPIKFICFGEKVEDIELFEINSITTQLINSVFRSDLSLS
ncbi:cell division protein FtsY [Mycoplasma ovis str. Michigan]|uniref:Cell division protein FtsY n=1 Tax=Mycoplasma ovis str. Michigan TaxID=1415773 RepID=A0ABM5P086_9MOLU|nr:cell division protein FtsY [Mycoplasma ovis]AHC39812.1 cell division protein FtsY [Mycoplasma ovis str. Michigan]